MAPRSRGAERALSSAISFPKLHICHSCRLSLIQHATPRRSYASAAAVSAFPSHPPPVTQANADLPSSSPVPQPSYAIKAGIVLSRPPLLTPTPHPFTLAYTLYQRRLNERLVLPFTQYLYYKRGTPTFEHWRKYKSSRGGVATRDIGPYNAYTPDSWNDEVLVGEEVGTPEKVMRSLVEEEGRKDEFVGQSGLMDTAGLRRRTDADEKNDTRSLHRSLERTLYLLVRSRKDGERDQWTFPTGDLEGKEGLHHTARRVLDTACGPNMNTWFVARHPIGHFVRERFIPDSSSTPSKSGESSSASSPPKTDPPESSSSESQGDKTFFLKARIFAGQADVKHKLNSAQKPPYDDFQWLTKQEIESLVHPRYWKAVKNMLVAQ